MHQFRTVLTEDQLLIITDLTDGLKETGCLNLTRDPTPTLRLSALAQIGWHLDMPLSDSQVSLIIEGVRDRLSGESHHDTMKELATLAHAHINALLPAGYWLVESPDGYLLTQTALLPLPHDAFS